MDLKKKDISLFGCFRQPKISRTGQQKSELAPTMIFFPSLQAQAWFHTQSLKIKGIKVEAGSPLGSPLLFLKMVTSLKNNPW